MTPFAFVFPGQGSQSVGMLDAWGDNAAVRQTLVEASDVLGEDVARLIREGPKEQLDLTTNTQPVMLTAAIACYRAWLTETGAEPAVVAGHSLGEYSALVAAGVLSLADALPLVRFRAHQQENNIKELSSHPSSMQSSQPVFIHQNGNDIQQHEDVEESLSIVDKEKELIIKALKKHKGKRKDASLDLGISERTLYRKLKEYDIEE